VKDNGFYLSQGWAARADFLALPECHKRAGKTPARDESI
jgi:hypothetical protein